MDGGENIARSGVQPLFVQSGRGSSAALLDADGLPFVLDRFNLHGRVPSIPALLDADAAPPPVPPRGLTDLDVVTLPDG